jgi:sugar lactone lactonase YvrE
MQAQTVTLKTLDTGYDLPFGVAVDRSGNLYIASVYKYGGAVYEATGCASGDCVTTTIGGGFYKPVGVAVDENGNIFVGDTENNAVKEMPPGCASASCVTTLGGGFNWPEGVAVDADGNVYVADSKNNAVKEMPAGCATASCVTTLGGGFNWPVGVAVDRRGNVYVSDNGNNAVKKIPAGCVAAACVITLADGVSEPAGIALDERGNIYLGGNSEARVIPRGCSSSSCVTALGFFILASNGVAVDASGNIYLTTEWGVYEITPGGVNSDGPGGEIMPPVGFGTVEVGKTGPVQTLTFTLDAGHRDVTASVVTQGAAGLDFTDAGGGSCDTNGAGYRYRRWESCTVNVTFAPKYAGARYGAVELSDHRGVIATAYIYGTGRGPELVFPSNETLQTLGGGFNFALGVAVDGSGNVYVADGGPFGEVKEVAAGCNSSACVTTLGGGFFKPNGLAVDGGGDVYVAYFGDRVVGEMPPGCAASSCVTALGGFYLPIGVAVDGGGNVYVADDESTGTGMIYEMPPGCTAANVASGICTLTVLGGGFSFVEDVAVDGAGNVYVADWGNNAVKEMPPGCASATCVTTLGSGFNGPSSVAVDGSGNVYVADTGNNLLKEIPPGCVSSSCVMTLGSFTDPYGLAVDGSGNVYAAGGGEGTSLVGKLNFASPPSLSFLTTDEGSESSDSPQTATLMNIGNAPLRFPIPWTGENPSVSANFTLDSSTTCPEVLASSSAGMLAAGANCELAVDFIPRTSGAISGVVVLTDDNLNVKHARQRIDLSGTGRRRKSSSTLR